MTRYRTTSRRTVSRSTTGPRLLFAVLMTIGIVIGARWFFHRSDAPTTTNTDPAISLINDPANTNAVLTNDTASVNSVIANTNVSVNSNANTNTAATNTSTTVAKAACAGALSQISTTQKKVALTFDMAADNDNVTTLLDSLHQQNIPATFFVSGTYATKHPATTKRIAAEFEMGNHGFATSSYAALTISQVKQQIIDSETAFQNALGDSEGNMPLLFRSPYGDTSANIVQGATQAGYCTILWTVDSFDWKNDQTAAAAATRAMDKLKPGAILLFHAGYDITAEAVSQVIASATSQGYSFVSVNQLLSTGGD